MKDYSIDWMDNEVYYEKKVSVVRQIAEGITFIVLLSALTYGLLWLAAN